MNIFLVLKIGGLSAYDADRGMTPDVDVLLATEEPSKAEEMVALAKRLGVRLEIREVSVE
jgi:hypothetical protein